MKRTIVKYKWKYPLNRVPATLGNPLSFFYEKYSKKISEIKKYNRIIEKDNALFTIQNRIADYLDYLNIKDGEIECISRLVYLNISQSAQLSDVEFIIFRNNLIKMYYQ